GALPNDTAFASRRGPPERWTRRSPSITTVRWVLALRYPASGPRSQFQSKSAITTAMPASIPTAINHFANALSLASFIRNWNVRRWQWFANSGLSAVRLHRKPRSRRRPENGRPSLHRERAFHARVQGTDILIDAGLARRELPGLGRGDLVRVQHPLRDAAIR